MIVLLIALLVFVVVAALAYWLAGKSRCSQYPKCECGLTEDCEVEHFGNPLADDLRGVGGGESLHARKPKEFVPVNLPLAESRSDYSVSDNVFFTPPVLAPMIIASTLDDTPVYVPADRERQAIAEVEAIEPASLDAGHRIDCHQSHDYGSSCHHDSSSHFDSGSGFSSSDF